MVYTFEEITDIELDSKPYSIPRAIEEGFARSESSLFFISVLPDTDCESPLAYQEELWRMAIWHRQYANPTPCFSSPQEVRRYCRETGAIAFGVEAYIHSGVALDLAGQGNFPDRQWDVGFFGMLIFEKKYFEELSWKRVSPKRHRELEALARSIVQEYGQWLNGECYGYIAKKIDPITGEELDIDSCFGFIGDQIKEGIKYVTHPG